MPPAMPDQDAKVWLKNELKRTLQWDDALVEGVVGALVDAGTNQAAVKSIVKDYMGGHPQAAKLVEQFFSGHKAALGPSPREQDAQLTVASQPSVPFSQSDEQLRAALGNLGTNVKTTIKRGTKQRSNQEAVLLKDVVNCLSCGKVYDCRQPGADAQRFLASGGFCTFCGKLVLLQYTDGSTNEGLAMAADGHGHGEGEGVEGTGNHATAGADSSHQGQEEATALRDKLVEYDRESARRTTVIDDQSDYFNIDANVWLSDEERQALRQQQRAMEEAAEQMKKRMHVTIDLIGRRVVLLDEAEAEGAKVGGLSAGAVEATKATAAERPQGGGTAAIAARVQEEGDMRIAPNPTMAASRYVFLPGRTTSEGGKRGGGSGKKEQQQQGVARLQHDDPFELAATELAELVATGSFDR